MVHEKTGTLKLAATYIGTVVGAGFASGQEVLHFFTSFGIKGFSGLIIATVLFIIFGYISMISGYELKARSHLRIIMHAGGKYLGTFIDYVITFFLFGSMTAMIAGAGALVRQQFGISPLWGNLAMVILTVLTVLTGTTGVINSISFVVPFLMTAAVGVSLAAIFIAPREFTALPVSYALIGADLVRSWWWAAILYVSYNMVVAVSVLGPLGNSAAGRKQIRNGAVLGGLGLGLGATSIYFSMLKYYEYVRLLEIPMAVIAGRISYIVQVAYIIILLAEVYTTSVGSLYGFTARVTDGNGKKAVTVTIGITLLAFAASQFGFSNLVRYLYPVVGYAGILLLGILLVSRMRWRLPGKKARRHMLRRNTGDS
jgi:uncharacterized membrane protein YkvI